jgi:NMD protein affecting ribosome stability and mRNA decay
MQHDGPEDHLRHDRHDRPLLEQEHDPYRARRKIKSPAYCPTCGATYVDGRWAWGSPADDAAAHVCPACQRIADRVPAAFLTISGEFARGHAEEIHHLIRNYEARERAEHPLKRIMAEEKNDEGSVFTFTDAHLARGIGEALHHAYQGELDYHYQKGEILLRVRWSR